MEFAQKNSKLFIDRKLQINTQYTEQNRELKIFNSSRVEEDLSKDDGHCWNLLERAGHCSCRMSRKKTMVMSSQAGKSYIVVRKAHAFRLMVPLIERLSRILRYRSAVVFEGFQGLSNKPHNAERCQWCFFCGSLTQLLHGH